MNMQNKVDELLRKCAKLVPEDDNKTAETDRMDITAMQCERFLFERKIGQGGMGIVYKAKDQILSREVAIKQIMIPSPSALRRFQREARNNASLHHPNIVAVHDFQVINDKPCIIMQYVKGNSLAHLLRERPLSLIEVYEIFSQILDGVEHAHNREIIHRDLKPSNILLDENNHVFITDFGIAKALDGSKTLSTTGEIIGTPMYMSPEQAKGEKVDRRSDVYSLGAILFEMLSGRPAFPGKTPFTILHRVVTEEPQLQPCDISINWERYCLKALAKDPGQRFSSVSEMKKRLPRLHSTKSKYKYIALACIATILLVVFSIKIRSYIKDKPKPETAQKETKKPQIIASEFMEEYDENQDGKINLKEWPFQPKSFKFMDKNKDSQLTTHELNKSVRQLFNHLARRREIVQRRRKNNRKKIPPFASLDKNSDGKLSKKEFDTPLFWKIDDNKDSVISKKEFRKFLRLLK